MAPVRINTTDYYLLYWGQTALQEKLENEMCSKIKYASFIFIICSVIGWCLEVIYRSAVTHSLFIPGFLIGPYCPIYGFGAIIVVFLCGSKSKLFAFLKVFILTSVLEYLISFIIEHVYNQVLWDYIELPFSIGKRISLPYSLVWGVLGLTFLLFAEPRVQSYYKKHQNMLNYLSYAGIALICADTVIKSVICFI